MDRIDRALMRGSLRYAQATLRWDQRIEPTENRQQYLEEIEDALKELEEGEWHADPINAEENIQTFRDKFQKEQTDGVE